MRKKLFLEMIILVILYIIMSIVIFSYTNIGLHLMLGWNVFLALIPFIAMFMIVTHKNMKKHWIILLLFVWFFFYPNAMYLITDLIYINSSDFLGVGLDYPFNYIYLQDTLSYLLFFHIFIGVILGIILAVRSYEPVYYYILEKKNRLLANGSIIVLSGISSFAIYLGRFLRFNSWDILRPWRIISEFFSTLSLFFIVFVLGFTMIQGLVLFLLIDKDIKVNRVD